MTNSIDHLAKRLVPHYSHFDVGNRLLFTGHSHQAWPDVALEGLKESFTITASEVDKKWDAAFKKAEVLRNYLRNYYDDSNGLYCLGENTHLLLVSWLSSYDLKNKPKVITTESEFHSMRRQLHRLQEEGLEIVRINAYSDKIAKKIEEEIDDRTSAIMLSRVYFESGIVNQHIANIAEVARNHDIPLLIDDYHGTNVLPLSIEDENLRDCYFLIGGYKYLQWGEGNCFLRFPKECNLRPVVTGWFASFSSLDKPQNDKPVAYDEGNQRFATGTYDPASQFRAAKVVEFFKEQGLTPGVLRSQYMRQVSLLKDLFLEQNFNPEVIKLRHDRPIEENGGFLALRSQYARKIQDLLMENGVYTDARADILRFGPAPYTTSAQIKEAIQKLAEILDQLNA